MTQPRGSHKAFNSVHAATHQGQKPKRSRRKTHYHVIYHKHLQLRTRKLTISTYLWSCFYQYFYTINFLNIPLVFY